MGDPPNVIIVSANWETEKEADIQFTEFTGHMFLGILFVSVVSFFALKFFLRHAPLDNPDPPRVAELKHELGIWQRTLRKLHHVSQSTPGPRDCEMWFERNKGEEVDVCMCLCVLAEHRCVVNATPTTCFDRC